MALGSACPRCSDQRSPHGRCLPHAAALPHLAGDDDPHRPPGAGVAGGVPAGRARLPYLLRHGPPALEATSLARWRTHLAQHTTLSPHTINRQLAAVKRLVKEAAAQGYVDVATAAAFTNVSSVKPQALKHRLSTTARTRITPGQMRLLCDAPVPQTLRGRRDRALLATLASSGCRVSEVVARTATQIVARTGRFVVQVLGRPDDAARGAAKPGSVHAHRSLAGAATGGQRRGVYELCGAGVRPTATAMSTAAVWQAVQQYAAAVRRPPLARRRSGSPGRRRGEKRAFKMLIRSQIVLTREYTSVD